MDNKEIIRTLYETHLNAGDMDGARQFISPEYVGIYNATGPDGFIQTVARVRTGFPDIKWHIEDLLAEGDKVALRWTWTGTHTGPLGDMPPTGKSVHDDGIAIYQLHDGKIIRSWVQTDRLGLMQQLGGAPGVTGPMKNNGTKE